MSYFVGNDRGKNQYENLGDMRTHATIRSTFSLIIIGFSLIFLILVAWNFSNKTNHVVVTQAFYLRSRQSILNIVSDKFLSFGLDASLLRDMKHLPILEEKFINLARHLAPAYVRFGGTSADCLYFNETPETTFETILSPVDSQDISNFAITAADFENLYNFASRSQLRMIFDVNALTRNEDGSWNDTNARDIISFAKQRNMKLDWQLANEPNSFHHVFNVTVTAVELGNNYNHLRQLLNEAGYSESILVGPEVNHVGDTNRAGEIYAETFLENDNDSIDYLTWHQYYLNGRTADVEDFIDPMVFNYLSMQIKSMKETIRRAGKNILMWLSETSSAYGGGAPELSDRFVAGFLWLDKLGYSAAAGLNVVTRQSLFGEHYAMVGPDLTPNPDWWVSVLYKQLVSEKVLDLSSTNNFGRLRFYAHCTPEKAWINRVPAITIYGINIDQIPRRIAIGGILPILQKNAKIFDYSLTADDLQSSYIRLNGEILKLQVNGELPAFRAVIQEPTETFVLPAYSMVFMVIHGAKMPECLA